MSRSIFPIGTIFPTGICVRCGRGECGCGAPCQYDGDDLGGTYEDIAQTMADAASGEEEAYDLGHPEEGAEPTEADTFDSVVIAILFDEAHVRFMNHNVRYQF